MSLGTVGLATWRWNNNIKSIAILAAFPALLLLLFWCIIYTFAAFTADPHGMAPPDLAQMLGIGSHAMAPLEIARLALWQYGGWVLMIACAWTGVSYFFQESFIQRATGARPVTRMEQPGLYNLLENLCITRGLHMPKLYIIDTPELNAFASGTGKDSFAITVTSGIVRELSRDELEAVLGHELTHIINRDVRLLMVTVIFAGMISFLAHMLWRSLSYAQHGLAYRRDGRRGGGPMLLMLVAGVFLMIGNLLALLLRLALSRRREYLADAGSVALTHNPEAMIGALRKISGHAALPFVPTEVRQMFIENPPGIASFLGLFATHPPIEDRIAVLERLTGTPPVPPGETHIPSTESP